MTNNQEAIDGCIKSITNFCEGNGCFGRYRDKVQNYEWTKKGKSIDELLEEYNSSNAIAFGGWQDELRKKCRTEKTYK